MQGGWTWGVYMKCLNGEQWSLDEGRLLESEENFCNELLCWTTILCLSVRRLIERHNFKLFNLISKYSNPTSVFKKIVLELFRIHFLDCCQVSVSCLPTVFCNSGFYSYRRAQCALNTWEAVFVKSSSKRHTTNIFISQSNTISPKKPCYSIGSPLFNRKFHYPWLQPKKFNLNIFEYIFSFEK